MRLSVTRAGNVINELRFDKGPIYFGRQMGSQVFLPDRVVSRQHAVIYTDKKGNWLIEDLESANKTFINRTAIHKTELKDGDVIKIGDFSIRFSPTDEEKEQARPIHLEDTVAPVRQDLKSVVRKLTDKGAPQIKLPSKRIKDFASASCLICKAANMEKLHRQILDILLSQFNALNTWVALKRDPDGQMEIEKGRKITSETVELKDLVVQQGIADAVGQGHYMLIPELPLHIHQMGVRSAIIAPVLKNQQCYGVLYVDNSTKHESYEPADLDYLMLLSLNVAAVLENI